MSEAPPGTPPADTPPPATPPPSTPPPTTPPPPGNTATDQLLAAINRLPETVLAAVREGIPKPVATPEPPPAPTEPPAAKPRRTFADLWFGRP